MPKLKANQSLNAQLQGTEAARRLLHASRRIRVLGLLTGGLLGWSVWTASAPGSPVEGLVSFADRIEILPLRDVRVALCDPDRPAVWRWGLGGVDWSAYRDWQLAIRIRSAEKITCRFRIELKGGQGSDAPCLTYRP